MRTGLVLILCSLSLMACSDRPSADRAEPRPSPSAAATPVSYAQAAEIVSYELPVVGAPDVTGELEGLFLRAGDYEGRAEKGPAVEYRWAGDLTLTVDPTLKGYDPRHYPMSHGVIVVPDLKGDYEEEPRWALRTVRDRPAVGVDPTEDHYSMLSWSERGVFLTFQSPSHPMEELIEIAESISFSQG